MVRKAKTVGDSLHRKFRLGNKHLLNTQNKKMLYPITSGMPRLLPDNGAEMLRRKAKEIGIKLHISVLMTVFYNSVAAIKERSEISCGSIWTIVATTVPTITSMRLKSIIFFIAAKNYFDLDKYVIR